MYFFSSVKYSWLYAIPYYANIPDNWIHRSNRHQKSIKVEIKGIIGQGKVVPELLKTQTGSFFYSSMNQDRDFKSRSKKRKRGKKVKALF